MPVRRMDKRQQVRQQNLQSLSPGTHEGTAHTGPPYSAAGWGESGPAPVGSGVTAGAAPSRPWCSSHVFVKLFKLPLDTCL